MKANELMIGDLVQVNRDGLCIKSGTIVKVLGLDSESKLEKKGLIGCAGCQPLDKEQFSGGIWCEYLSPIPLTPEILEKNGWITGQFYSEILIEELQIQWDGAVLRLRNGEYFEICIPIKYVHTLQHALRLCGIDKQITI